MIVWIIEGKTKSVKEAVDYVCDKEKTSKNFEEIKEEYEANEGIKEELSFEQYYVSVEDDFNKALNYIANEDKIGGYISGYLCDPEAADEQFRLTKEINLARVGKTLDDDNGAYFYHIIQSFPKELDISDDEVHRCGLELVEKLGLYQAVVTSHIHPAIDEEGEVHGECKHNHIIINSHIYHELVDPTRPQKMKYHDCKETYAQLQLINDQIAIEHGLPVIINQDNQRSYSWFENEEKNKGRSWKQTVRNDIQNAMKISSDMKSFEEAMRSAGYKIRYGNSQVHGQYITYTCPDNTHRVRDYILKQGCTYEDLEAYWSLKNEIENVATDRNEDGINKIEAILSKATSLPLYVKFEKKVSNRRADELNKQNRNIKNSYTNYFPIGTGDINKFNAEATYFEAQKTYEIVNAQHQVIAEVDGEELLEYFEHLRLTRQKEKEEEEKTRRIRQETEFYTNYKFRQTSTGKPYKVGMWDKYGRKRTTIELIVILAITVLQKEGDKWNAPQKDLKSVENQSRPLYAKRDWKIQNMIDTIKIARENEIEEPSAIETKIAETGKQLSKFKAEQRRLTAAKNKMDLIHDNIESYMSIKEICEKIFAMPEGDQKEKAKQQYAEELKEYNNHRSFMYRHNIKTNDDIADFEERYNIISQKIPSVEEELKKKKQEYSQLMKLKYNLQLAENQRYCYGPQYKESEQEQTPEQPDGRND